MPAMYSGVFNKKIFICPASILYGILEDGLYSFNILLNEYRPSSKIPYNILASSGDFFLISLFQNIKPVQRLLWGAE